ncbi:MAG: ABC transporter permease, partial [Planctomycetota bacterium]
FDFYAPVRTMVWITALLVAMGAFFGGLNTLYAAFAARIRELASLQVLGFSRGAILWSLVQESALLAAAGSLVAGIVALLLLDGLAVRISMGAFGLDVNGTVMALGMGSGALLGLCGALPAAWRCLRMPVATALKSA